jgi:GDP-D-mannose dehydratase
LQHQKQRVISGEWLTKTALMTGRTGQDTSYLAKFFLLMRDAAHVIKSRASLFNTEGIDVRTRY